jgi:hypothetical protein
VAVQGTGTAFEGGALSFAWDFNDDLLYETNGQSPVFSAVGIPPGTTRTVRVRTLDARGAYSIASTTVTVTAAPCTLQRPNVRVTTAKVVAGRLQVTLAAQTSPSIPTNSLTNIRFTTMTNADVRLNNNAVTAGPTFPLAAGAQEATLVLARQTPGLPSTVSFVVSDACGEWKSFVGGGPSAF